MKRGFKLAISNRPSVERGFESVRLSGLGRVKLFLGGLLFAAVAVAVLIVILIVGSILAAVIWTALVLAIVGLILKATLRRVSK